MRESEKIQKEHYNQLAVQYEQHYDDSWSRKYRNFFIYKYLFNGVSLDQMVVMEAMCGSGQATVFLKQHGAKVIGLDISESLIESFRRKNPADKAVCASIFATGFPDAFFDGVVVIGGLHHLHPQVDEAIQEIHRILKPEGFFCFCEPSKGSVFDLFRQAWYRKDKSMFESNEEAIDVNLLKEKFSSNFHYELERYRGGLAYLFVFNSLVFRIPLFMKKFYSYPLFIIEWFLQPFSNHRFSMFVLCRWRKVI